MALQKLKYIYLHSECPSCKEKLVDHTGSDQSSIGKGKVCESKFVFTPPAEERHHPQMDGDKLSYTIQHLQHIVIRERIDIKRCPGSEFGRLKNSIRPHSFIMYKSTMCYIKILYNFSDASVIDESMLGHQPLLTRVLLCSRFFLACLCVFLLVNLCYFFWNHYN